MQPQSRESVNIGQIFFRMCGDRNEGACGQRIALEEGLPNLGADFELQRADGRPQPGEDLAGTGVAHGRDGVFEYAIEQATPARMRGTDDASLNITEQHWQAVGCLHDAHDAGLIRKAGIGFEETLDMRGIDHVNAVNLRQPHGRRRQQRRQPRTIRLHCDRIITDMAAQIHATLP